MFLGGLWHGASWNFVLWGVLHGLALAVHKIWLELLVVSRLSIKIPNFVGAFFTFHFVCFCWIFFRNTSFENSLNMIRQIFVNFHVDVLPQMIIGYWPVFVLMMIGFLLHFAPDNWEKACCSFITRIPLWAKALIIILVVFVIIQVKSADIQPFIYFQF
jgi:D-alanyl-lipoteichoic acid acyltransferase DltB (MBOAT superfamily)